MSLLHVRVRLLLGMRTLLLLKELLHKVLLRMGMRRLGMGMLLSMSDLLLRIWVGVSRIEILLLLLLLMW